MSRAEGNGLEPDSEQEVTLVQVGVQAGGKRVPEDLSAPTRVAELGRDPNRAEFELDTGAERSTEVVIAEFYGTWDIAEAVDVVEVDAAVHEWLNRAGQERPLQ